MRFLSSRIKLNLTFDGKLRSPRFYGAFCDMSQNSQSAHKKGRDLVDLVREQWYSECALGRVSTWAVSSRLEVAFKTIDMEVVL